MRARLWPTGLVGRVGLVLFTAVLLELIGSTFLFEQAELLTSDQNQAERIADGIDSAARVLAVTDPVNRPLVASTLSERELTLTWEPRGRMPALAPGDAASDALRVKIVAAAPSLAGLKLALARKGVRGDLPLADGSSLAFRAVTHPGVPSYVSQVWSIVLLSGCVLLAALLLVRTLAAPLRMLVQATDAIGHGPSIQIDERGPREIRRVALAFNAMQTRIGKLIADRTHALAAVSHDLRTPIGRMRLRTGFLPSGEDRDAFEADLAEMEAMLADLLAYLGGETDPEKPRRTDLAATMATLTDNATDAGHRARYDGPDQLVIEARPLALKRALSNIVGNAIAYGSCAHLALREDEDFVTVTVEDEGPGIPVEEMGAVFEPFYRVDASRNRSVGGMGLGLAITRQAILREGGEIKLANLEGGGLRVTIVLPRR